MGIQWGCWPKAHAYRVSLEEPVWIRLIKDLEQRRKKHECGLTRDEEEEEDRFSIQTQCVGTGGLTQLAKQTVAPAKEQFTS